MNRNHKIELLAARGLLGVCVVIAGASLLSGCQAIEKQVGGQVLGASVTLAGVTVSLSGTIPTGEKSSGQVAQTDPPASK